MAVGPSTKDVDRRRREALEALEALFTPKPPLAAPSTRSLAKIVAAHAPREDAARELKVADLLAAEGPDAVRRAVLALEHAGYGVPDTEDAQLQMLAHPDDARVRAALDAWGARLGSSPVRRKAILDGRLRHLEDLAEDPALRSMAAALRRRLHRTFA